MSLKETWQAAEKEAKEANRKEDIAYNNKTDARNIWHRDTHDEHLAEYQYAIDEYIIARNTAEIKSILAKRARIELSTD